MYFMLVIVSFCTVIPMDTDGHSRFNNTSSVDSDMTGCFEESTNERKPVVWPYTTEYNVKITSKPLCLTESLELVTRVCEESGWNPTLENVPDCAQVVVESPKDICAPGYRPAYKKGGDREDFCYQFTEPTTWQYPCLNSGSSLTVSDLDEKEFKNLVKNLDLKENNHVWLPAKRTIQYGPLVWTTPGEKWGKIVETDEFPDHILVSRFSIIQDCLLLNLEDASIRTENCSFQYPSLCIAKEEHLLQLHCPSGYFASQYGLNNGLCYGLEISVIPLTWDEFHKKCPVPITINNNNDNYIPKELFMEYGMEFRNTCWTGLVKSQNNFIWQSNTSVNYVNWDPRTNFDANNIRGAINENQKWQIFNNDTKLSCMVCQVDVSDKELEMELKYVSDYVQLTIYNPQRLWKEEESDFGIRCFSNANGFQTRVFMCDDAFVFNKQLTLIEVDSEAVDVIQKVMYRFEPINDQSGEYWCEGHDSRNFSLVKSSVLYVPAQEEEKHVFVLKIRILKLCETILSCNPDWEDVTERLEELLDIEYMRVMFVNNLTNASAIITFHVPVPLISHDCTNTSCRIYVTYRYFQSYVKAKFRASFKKNKSKYMYEFIYLKSTRFCLPMMDQNDSLSWEMAKVGETIAPVQLCMKSNGLPVTRTCMGSFLYGAEWGDVMGVCSEDFEPTNRTAFLYSVAKGRVDVATTSSFLVHDLTTVLQNKEDIIPADIFFLGLSLRTVLQLFDKNSSSVEIGDSLNIATAINSVMGIEEEYLKLAQTMNSSNILLESVDLILTKIALNTTDEHFVIAEKDLAITPHFIIQISCPHINNISGLAILKSNNSNNEYNFKKSDILDLTVDMTLSDILEISNLEAAVWVSQELLDSLQYQNTSSNVSTTPINPRLIFEMFRNDVVFQETKKNTDKVNSRVISVSIPGYDTELSVPVFLIYRKLDKTIKNNVCVFWDIGLMASIGGWSKKGCYLVESFNDLDVCACLHLTHFAQLVHGFRGSGNKPGDTVLLKYHGQALNAITVIGCSLSLVGVAGIAATAIIFPAWRQKPGSKILLQLSAALALESIIMLAQDSIHPSDPHCITLGALLHYSVLASFTWMLLTAILQFARYVRVLGVQRPVRFMIKFSAFGWGLPIIPVALLLILDPASYLPPATLVVENSPETLLERDPLALCYPQGLGLVLCCLLPIACIVSVNLVVFILVMRSITKVPEGVRRPTDPDLLLSQLRLSILLFFLLGLTWIFGFLAATSKLVLFSYLFCVTATLQGFILFVYFIVCDPTTRVLWVSLVREKSISPSKSSVKEISVDTK